MSEIIVLSDSSESASSNKDTRSKKSNGIKRRKNTSPDNISANEFHFLELEPQDDGCRSDSTDLPNNEFDKNSLTTPNSQRSYMAQVEKPPSKLPSKAQKTSPKILQNLKTRDHRNSAHDMSNSSDSNDDSDNEKRSTVNKRENAQITSKGYKNMLATERSRKREQLARDRALKSIALKKLRDIKPGECMKFMEVLLDKGIENFAFCTDITNALDVVNIRYSFNTELIPNSITWRRNIEESYVDEANQICTIINKQTIERALIIWNCDETLIRVADDTFCTSVSRIKALLPEYSLTLVIYGMEDYFAHKKQTRNKTQSGTRSKSNKTSAESSMNFKNLPEVSRRRLETCLNEIQIICKCNSRLIDNPRDLAAMVCQYTKAIAETPFKLEKNKNIDNQFDWYVTGDNKNTVRVDKDGNGLRRLWQQQLCQFNLSSLEIAEAICSAYPSPANLIEAYRNCTHDGGMNLLKDIPIRRAAGPLTATRKVGPELSKKIYLMFTSIDGDTAL